MVCDVKIMKLFSSGRGLIRRVWPRKAAHGADMEGRNAMGVKWGKHANTSGEGDSGRKRVKRKRLP